MQSNYEIFTEVLLKTLSNLQRQYLAKGLFEKEQGGIMPVNAMDRTDKFGCVIVFEQFCELMQHILSSCNIKRIYFNLFGVFTEFLVQLKNSFSDAFAKEVVDTHFMKQFDKAYYSYEKNTIGFRSVKYKFLYTPVADTIDVGASSILFSQSDTTKQQEIEYALLHFKCVAPQSHWISETHKIRKIGLCHINCLNLFESIDNMFQFLSHSTNKLFPGRPVKGQKYLHHSC